MTDKIKLFYVKYFLTMTLGIVDAVTQMGNLAKYASQDTKYYLEPGRNKSGKAITVSGGCTR